MTISNRPIHQEELDQLVDGELSEPARRELLKRIDSTADNWRRCALAFLDAHEFRRAMVDRSGRNGKAPRGEIADFGFRIADLSQSPPNRRLVSARVGSMMLALAVFLAFGGGMALDRFLQRGPGGGAIATPLVESELRDLTKPEARPVDETLSREPIAQQNAAIPGDQRIRPAVHGKSDEIRVVGLVRVAGDGTTNGNYVMPVFAGQGLDQNWLQTMPLPYSDDDIQQFKRDGYNVLQRRQLMQVELADGQNLAIPFGTVQLQYVGNEIH